ncbi:hypothetical protein J7624_09765 [Wohlfahrtiimonas chitiniclastica]|uniref:hypothetical protein n=1 Tax=Wohlfahrtiimonas chitiniclastica TaxID=400946 RepID=UPI001BCE8FD4|nr:hypothetical protein [Wohlfahrtiimonas chitiniclastica]MBS7827429.1 hypothetical protein [Wohlfahrtiimonas chitiniclastica]
MSDVLSHIVEFFANTNILTIMIAVSGWIFVYKDARALQVRSETWSIIKNLSDNLKEIETSTRKFWISSDADSLDPMIFQSEITTLLGETERWMGHLHKRVPIKEDYKPLIKAIFKHATLDSEQRKVKNLPKRNSANALVASNIKQVKAIVDNTYTKKFYD